MTRTIEEKLEYLKRIFELVSPMRKSPMAIDILMATAEFLELSSDFSVIEEEYDDFLKRSKLF